MFNSRTARAAKDAPRRTRKGLDPRWKIIEKRDERQAQIESEADRQRAALKKQIRPLLAEAVDELRAEGSTGNSRLRIGKSDDRRDELSTGRGRLRERAAVSRR
jgi:hypothetical protein